MCLSAIRLVELGTASYRMLPLGDAEFLSINANRGLAKGLNGADVSRV
jgi:hypothetical protein